MDCPRGFHAARRIRWSSIGKMNFLESPWIGYICLAFGLTTLVLRQVRPELFGKLEAMKERFGDRAGYMMHLVSYSLLPIAYGASILWMSYR